MMLYLEDFLEKKENNKMDPSTSADNQDGLPTEEIVRHLKSQGIFDEFRRECLSDIDTKRSYHNLIQRVTSYTSTYLAEQTWTPNINKNILRDNLRKHINHIPMIVNGLKHLVDQVIGPKVHSLFLPQIEKETLCLAGKPEDPHIIQSIHSDFHNYSHAIQNINTDFKNDSHTNHDVQTDLKNDSAALKEENNLCKDITPSQKPDAKAHPEKLGDTSKSPLSEEDGSKKNLGKNNQKETIVEKVSLQKDQQKENVDIPVQNSSNMSKPNLVPPVSKLSNSSTANLPKNEPKDPKSNQQVSSKPKPKPAKLIDISELIFDSATGSSMNNKIVLANKKNIDGKMKEPLKDDKLKKRKIDEKAPQDAHAKKMKEEKNETDEKVKKENPPKKDLKDHLEFTSQKSSSHSTSKPKDTKTPKYNQPSSMKKTKHSHHKSKDEHKSDKSKPKFNLNRTMPEVDLKQIFASDSSDDDMIIFPTQVSEAAAAPPPPPQPKKAINWADICDSNDSSDSDFAKELKKWNQSLSCKRKSLSDSSEDEAPKAKHIKIEPLSP